MNVRYYPVFSLIAVLAFAVMIIRNFDFYMSYPEGRIMLAALGCILAVGVIALAYTSLLAFAPKMLYKAGFARCPSCYAKLKKGTGFCPKCGKVVDRSEMANQLYRCGRCGWEIDDPSREFCPKCGSSLRK